MHRTKVLEEANRLTTGDRLKSYGSPYKNHADIAAGWSVILGKQVTPAEVALCMAWLKIARTVKDPKLVDSYVDGAAYMAIAGELIDGEPKVTSVALSGAGLATVPLSNMEWPMNDGMAGMNVYSPAVTIMEPDDEAA